MTHRERVLAVLGSDSMFHPKIMDEALGLKAVDIFGTPGGRYILSTFNSPAIPDIPTEEYGNYPIEYPVKTDRFRKHRKQWR